MRSGGFILDHWWKAGNHVLPQHLHTLVNAVRDEGGALRTKLFVVCTPLSCNNAGVTRRSLADVSELACLFSAIIIVLCDCHDESILHGLKVHYITVNADVLVCAGLQAGTRVQLESVFVDDLMAPSAKVASLLRSNADLVLRTHDHDLECKHLTSSACPCAADHQISPNRDDSRFVEQAPVAPFSVATQGNTARLEWVHSLLWCAVFGDELSQTIDEDYAASLASIYSDKPPQLAAQISLTASANCDQFPNIRRLCEVGDEGLARIQPGDSRGRERGVIVVSDSTTIFMAGKRTFGDLAPDFAKMREGSGILSHYSLRPHMGGIPSTHRRQSA